MQKNYLGGYHWNLKMSRSFLKFPLNAKNWAKCQKLGEIEKMWEMRVKQFFGSPGRNFAPNNNILPQKLDSDPRRPQDYFSRLTKT